MSTMDEITYWIYTKRAPCLMYYDRVSNKAIEEGHSSETKPKSVPSNTEVPLPKKRKRRKLSLLDDDSGSVEKQQNVYFNTSQNQKQTVISSCKSGSMGSDIDFNIRNGLKYGKQKQCVQKTSRIARHKKDVITSTPKKSQLRRSVRQAQLSLNNNSHLNNSLELMNSSFVNSHNQNHSIIEHNCPNTKKKSTQLLANGDQTMDNKNTTGMDKFNRSKHEILNGQFDDLSDVSGLTANYIRSTKLQSTKTPRKIRCKNNRNLVNESKPFALKDCKMIVCADKCVNTATQITAHDCSTESENVINLVTTKTAERTPKSGKSTSLLKFMDSRPVKDDMYKKKLNKTQTRAKVHLNVSYESQGSTPRYPKRCRNISTNQDEDISDVVDQVDRKRKMNKNCKGFNNSDRKENPEATTVSKTRSGRSMGLSLRQPENLVLVLSNSTEQMSSMTSMNVASSKVSMNVASPNGDTKERKKKLITRHLRSKKVSDKHGSAQKDSLKDKSGFAACFSDSDDDSEPLKPRKFFCA